MQVSFFDFVDGSPPAQIHTTTIDADRKNDPLIRIVVHGEPVAKGRPRIGRMSNGRPCAFTPAHTKKYENLVRMEAGHAMEGRAPYDQPLIVRVIAYMPIPKSFSKKKTIDALAGYLRPIVKPDADNFLKSAVDACNGVVYRDDNIITDMYVSKRYSDRPRLEIEVFA